jgi:hypothetical protein
MNDKIMENRILPAGTGYWSLKVFPIGGSFHRTVLDVEVTVERTFKNCHGATAQGKIVASGLPIAYSLDLTQPRG